MPKASVRPLWSGRVLIIESRRLQSYDKGKPGVLIYIFDTTRRGGDGQAIAKGELSLDPKRKSIQTPYEIPVGRSISTMGL